MQKLLIPLLLIFVIFTGCTPKDLAKPSILPSHIEFGKDDYKTIVSPNNELAFDLMTTVPKDENGNLFLSPTSLSMALAMLYNGADGKAKEEIAKALHLNGLDASQLNQANASLISMIFNDTSEIQLDIGNSIWINDNYHFQTEFVQQNKDYYQAEIKEIDIHDNKSVDLINNWVKKATNDKIDSIVDSPLNPDLVTLLINAIYFKGDWSHPFDKNATKNRTFYIENGSTKEQLLMSLTEKLSYLETDAFQAISLPYGNGDMSMKVFLPKEHMNMKEFEQLLTTEQWEEWMNSFHQKRGTLLLPKFQLEYEAELNDTLQKLGMETAFIEANFSKMIEEDVPLRISAVKQKTFLDVNEEGTEAAAVTSVGVEATSAPIDKPFYMEVNRPFFITISHEETNTILFIGSISNPQ